MPKRLFNLAVSLIVGIADWLLDGVSRVFGVRRSKCMVLAYHAVSPSEPNSATPNAIRLVGIAIISSV